MIIFLLAAALGGLQVDTTSSEAVLLEIPSPEEFWGQYPERARTMGRSGEVTIACTASRRGDLTRCKVVKEAPLGFGFGQAALSLAPAFRFRPSTRDGLSLEGAKVTLPIKFSPPDMPQYRP